LCIKLLFEKANSIGIKIEAYEIMNDHVHLFIQVGPTDRPSDIARTLKSVSAVHLFTKFADLKGRKFWGSGLWSPSTFYGSVGKVDEEVIKRYISEQKTKSGQFIPGDEPLGLLATRNKCIMKCFRIHKECVEDCEE